MRFVAITMQAMALSVVTTIPAGAANLLQNPHFTAGASPWQSFGATPLTSPDDVNGSAVSGSFELTVGGDIPVGVIQCVELGSDAVLELSLASRRSALTGSGLTYVQVTWYSAPSCSSSVVGSVESAQLPLGDGWSFATALSMPDRPSAGSVAVVVGALATSGAVQVHLDDVYLGPPTMFQDGFEAGDGSRWNASAP